MGGQTAGRRLEEGNVQEAARVRWSRPMSHKVAWDHSSSRGVNLMSAGDQEVELAGSKSGRCPSQARWARDTQEWQILGSRCSVFIDKLQLDGAQADG